MSHGKLKTILIAVMVIGTASFARAQMNDNVSLTLSTAVCREWRPVSVFTLPNSAGDPMSACYLYGGTVVDATITLTLVDGTPSPIYLYPIEDLWLATENGGLVACPGGTVADYPTDASGWTTWSSTLRAGGHSDYAGGEGCVIIVNGDALAQAPLPIYFNSADITGDLVVDISDVTIFCTDYFGDALYRSDFHWDGVMDVSDVVKFAPAFGEECSGYLPPKRRD